MQHLNKSRFSTAQVDLSNLIWFGLLWARAWTRWPPGVHSNYIISWFLYWWSLDFSTAKALACEHWRCSWDAPVYTQVWYHPERRLWIGKATHSWCTTATPEAGYLRGDFQTLKQPHCKTGRQNQSRKDLWHQLTIVLLHK